MIKNILFDMGNVLIRFEPKQYVKNAGLSESDQQLLLRELYGSIDWVRLDRGTLTEAEVIDRCVSRVGEHLRGALPVIAAVHAVGKPPQTARDRVAERPFIFHNQNMHTILLVRIYECPTLLTLLYDNTKA